MALPVPSRLERARELDRKYATLIKVLGPDTLLGVEEVGALFAEAEAELTVVRLALAVAASKQEGKYPAKLSEIEPRFGGRVPLNPYNGQPVELRALDGGAQFVLSLAATGDLPAIDFHSQSPLQAQ